MEKFYAWMMKPISSEDVEVWFNANGMVPEKRELFADFTYSLYNLIRETYLGNEPEDSNETSVILSDEEKYSHFEWCWKKTIDNFEKENIRFKLEGDHKDFYRNFFVELFYFAENKSISENIYKFYDELFDERKVYTKSDLDMVTDIYKKMNKNLK
jgi:hypothetical protein